jgi:hypothetical protein
MGKPQNDFLRCLPFVLSKPINLRAHGRYRESDSTQWSRAIIGSVAE